MLCTYMYKLAVDIITGKSRKGELSIFAKSLIVLAPCLHMLPRHIAVHGTDEAHSKVKNPLQTNLPCTSPSMLIDVCWQKNVKEDNSSWNPGKARNPETYTLKDQVYIYFALTLFIYSSVYSAPEFLGLQNVTIRYVLHI